MNRVPPTTNLGLTQITYECSVILLHWIFYLSMIFLKKTLYNVYNIKVFYNFLFVAIIYSDIDNEKFSFILVENGIRR